MYDYYKEDCKLIYHKKKFIILIGKFDTLKAIPINLEEVLY